VLVSGAEQDVFVDLVLQLCRQSLKAGATGAAATGGSHMRETSTTACNPAIIQLNFEDASKQLAFCPPLSCPQATIS